MKTAVVILNFNGVRHLNTFLPSVIKNTQDADIWVADNGSTDASIILLEKEFPAVKVLSLAKNHGFAGGYNEALKKITADYYVLLNSDVEVAPNWLLPLIHQLESSANVVACQPKILSYKQKNTFEYAGAAGGFLDKWGYPFCRGRIFDHCEKDHGQYNQPSDIFWATGACLAIKSEIFHRLGGFDASFFAHMEEIDLCWRIHNAGFIIKYEPNSTVYHLGGGTLNKSNPHKTFLNYRNSLAMLAKNLPKNELFFKILSRLLLDGISGLKLILDGQLKDVLAIIKAHFSFYAMLPALLKASKGKPRSSAKLYPKSIVWAYFGKKLKTYPELDHA